MNRLALVAACLAMSSGALAGSLAGCSSSESTPEAADAAQPVVDASTTDSEVADSGADTSTTTSGVGKVACGTSACSVPTEYCCASDAGSSCKTDVAACTGTSAKLRCDEPADCDGGTAQCCFGSNNSFCSDQGCGPQLVLCQSDSQCGAGDAGGCRTVTCDNDLQLKACNTNVSCK